MKIIVLVKETERYVFHYDDPDALLKIVGVFAARADLGFTWYDAAIISQRIRREEVRK